MNEIRSINVQQVIDNSPVSAVQKRSLALCLGFGVVDGFDSLIIGFVVPAIARDWNTSVSSLTSVTLAGVIGTIFGTMFLAPSADKYGRRILILSGSVVFGIFTLAAASAPNPESLTLLRFAAGLGLGAVPATLIAYGSETAPARLRGTFVTVIGAGLAAGGFVGGLAAGVVIPALGWRSVFVIGGVAPILLVLTSFRWLPETVQFAALSGRRSEAVRRIAQIDPAVRIDDETTLVIGRANNKNRSRLRSLLASERKCTTVTVWILYFCQFVASFFLFSWLPSLLTNAGLGDTAALVATSICTLGGMVGGVALGFAVDRATVQFASLAISYLVGALATVLCAFLPGEPPALLVALFVAGAGVIGTGVCMNSVAANLYPTSIRTTAIGWFNGFGRVGSVVGPAIGGLLLATTLSTRGIFLLSAVPVVVCAICVGIIGLLNRAQDSSKDSASMPAARAEHEIGGSKQI